MKTEILLFFHVEKILSSKTNFPKKKFCFMSRKFKKKNSVVTLENKTFYKNNFIILISKKLFKKKVIFKKYSYTYFIGF